MIWYTDVITHSFSSLKQLRSEVQTEDASFKAKELEQKGTGSYGYGGKYGVQKDRMDKVQ